MILLLIVKAEIHVWVTTARKLLSNETFEGEGFFYLLKEKRSSLHLEVFNCSLFAIDRVWISSRTSCAVVKLFLWIISDIKVSSMYFQLSTFEIVISFVITINSQGPSLYPEVLP